MQPGLTSYQNWYALKTRYRHEKKVDFRLKEKRIHSYLPLNLIYRKWSDRYQEVLQPLFSCYVFVSIRLQERLPVLQTDGVIGFVTFNGKPATIPDNQINIIKRILDEKVSIHRANFFTPGKKVKVIRGPLKDYQGILIQKNNKHRFVITIDGIRQALSIEIDYRDLQII